MKKKFIVKLTILLLIGPLFFAGCNDKKKEAAAAHNHTAKQQYTCPMHPDIVRDQPGKCPICSMDLVPKQTRTASAVDTSLTHLLKPVNEQVVARTTTIMPEPGIRIYSIEIQGSITYDTRRKATIASRVSGRIERLYVKFNYQPVTAGQLIMEIYSPDLAAAQRELLYLNRSRDEALLQKARQRLQLLGMQPAQIQQVIRTGKVLYRVPVFSNATGYILENGAVAASPTVNTSSPAGASQGGGMDGMQSGGGNSGSAAPQTGSAQMPAENAPVLLREGQYVSAGQSLFTVYNNNSLVAEFAFNPTIAPHVKRGQKLVFRKIADPETVYTGSIGLIQPTFRAGQNFTLARVYLTDRRFQIGQFVSANIPVVNRGWWVPTSAVLELGSKTIVFKKEGNVFVPRTVTRGISAEGMVQIMAGVSGWEIAQNAAYLVDSESFIRVNSTDQIEPQ